MPKPSTVFETCQSKLGALSHRHSIVTSHIQGRLPRRRATSRPKQIQVPPSSNANSTAVGNYMNQVYKPNRQEGCITRKNGRQMKREQRRARRHYNGVTRPKPKENPKIPGTYRSKGVLGGPVCEQGEDRSATPMLQYNKGAGPDRFSEENSRRVKRGKQFDCFGFRFSRLGSAPGPRRVISSKGRIVAGSGTTGRLDVTVQAKECNIPKKGVQ
jgi:hypothetical protein